LHTLKIQLHTPVLSVDYQQVKRLVYAVYAKTNKKILYSTFNQDAEGGSRYDYCNERYDYRNKRYNYWNKRYDYWNIVVIQQ